MKKLILNWLFGTDNVQSYMDVLSDCMDIRQKHIDAIDAHIKSLEKGMDDIETVRKLIRICKNHGIDVDEEFAQIDNIK